MTEAEKILKKLTIDDKAALISQFVLENTDVSEYGLTNFLLADGPSGIRKVKESGGEDLYDTVPLTCYPSASTYACSWDRQLLRSLGRALGREARAEGVSVLLGPGCNIKRSPLGGRNFEYYSEDPVLTSELATEYILGLQEEGTGACVKHYAANNQETRRMTINEEIDERTLHEIYLKAFEKPVREGRPWMVMAAYNRINGEYGAESDVTLKSVLRERWGYEGNVITDCFGGHHLSKALKNGLNLQMAGESAERLAEEVKECIEKGEMTEADLDRAVLKTIELALRCRDNDEKKTYEPETHHAFAGRVARDSMVLLKNEDGFLPLKKTESLAVIGGLAVHPRFQGGGSSHVTPYRLECLLDGIRAYCPDAVFAAGYEADQKDATLLEEAVRAAQCCQKVILALGLPEIYESEGYDRTHMRLPECQIELLERIYEVNPAVAVVLYNGAPVELPWLSRTKALLEAYLPGEAGGYAAADLLFGEANPCGRLAESFPVKLSDTPCYLNFPGGHDTVKYREGIYVGYRYYDKKEMEVAFPFGFGLSYTTFSIHDLQAEKQKDGYKISVQVTNTGAREGKEVVQVYVGGPAGCYDRPIRELKAFEKLSLEPGETKTAVFVLDRSVFAVYDEEMHDWVVEQGHYTVEIGRSSRDICQTAVLDVPGDGRMPAVTEDTCLGDMIERFGKKQQLEEILKGKKESLRFVKLCFEEDPMIRSMGTLMSFQTLRRVDNELKGEDISRFLRLLNENI